MNKRMVKVCELCRSLTLSSDLLTYSECFVDGFVKLIKTKLTESQNCAVRSVQAIVTGQSHSGSNVVRFVQRIAIGLTYSGSWVVEFFTESEYFWLVLKAVF
jgi:hypothetical protein